MKYGADSGLGMWINGHRMTVFFVTRDRDEWERHIASRQTELRLGPGIRHLDWEKVGDTLCPEADWSEVACDPGVIYPNRPRCNSSTSLRGARRSGSATFWRCRHCRTLWASPDGKNGPWEKVKTD